MRLGLLHVIRICELRLESINIAFNLLENMHNVTFSILLLDFVITFLIPC